MLMLQSAPRRSKFIWLLVTLVFIGDLIAPLGWDMEFLYLLALFLSVSFKEKSDVLLLAVITTVLTIIAAVLKPQEIPLEQMLFERLPAIAAFWAAAFFVIRFIALREEEQQKEEKFRALFEHAVSGILLTNRKGTIVMANPAAERLFGYDIGELPGNSIEILIPIHLRHRHEGHRDKFHRGPQPRGMGIGLDLKGITKDGSEFPVEVSLSPFHTSEGEFVVAFIVDNTKRKQYEHSILQQKHELAGLSEALKTLNEDLENKVVERTSELEQAKDELAVALDKERELGELKSRFVSMASHEFRTPLTSVLSSAGLIAQYADRQDMDNIKKHAERIKNGVNGLNTILTEFLSLGRLEEGHIQPRFEDVSLTACIENIHQEMKNLFKPGQEINHNHEGSDTAHLDCHLVKNILINLISNAIKYSPEQSVITVKSIVKDGKTRISVCDQGIGIPESEQKHLFDRFFRASNATNIQGTGLGLYIVQRYAEVMGGKVGFTSAIEQGSEFWVEFTHQE